LIDLLYNHVIEKYKFAEPDKLSRVESKNIERGGSMTPILRDIRKSHGRIKQMMIKIEVFIMEKAESLSVEENSLLIKF
jgi:hypothetical protein